jgi:hypothetical protein
MLERKRHEKVVMFRKISPIDLKIVKKSQKPLIGTVDAQFKT